MGQGRRLGVLVGVENPVHYLVLQLLVRNGVILDEGVKGVQVGVWNNTAEG